MSKGNLFVISGPSGAGKGTICKELTEIDKKIEISVSMTTRKPRPGEEDGINYFFVDRDFFESMIRNKGFLEYADVYGNYYGTPKDNVAGLLQEGKDVILEIDVQGALQVKASHPEGILIFILPPSIGEIKKRIEERGGETEEDISRRVGEAIKEISLIGHYDYRVVNEDLSDAVRCVHAIIMSERSRIGKGMIHEILRKYEEEF